MPYPEKGAKYAGQDRANKIASRAEGGKIERLPITPEQYDHNRGRWDRAIRSTADKYGTRVTEDAVARYPKAKLYLHPKAPRCRGGRTRLKTQ